MVVGFVDTDIVIDIMRRYQTALDWLATQEQLGIAIPVRYEVIYGAPNKRELKRASEILSDFEAIVLTEEDQWWADKQLSTHRLKDNVGILDAQIASVAFRLQLPLYTRNLKHYKPLIGELALKPYD